MYLADALRDAPAAAARLAARSRPGTWSRLGLVSLATDVSSEMVTAVLPAYLVLGLHLSLAQYGLLDGIYTGATALTRLLGGWCADRFQAAQAGRRARLRAVRGGQGRAVLRSAPRRPSAPCWPSTGPARVCALRPRDALIALSVDERDLGQAFGLHRAMDSTGAFLGPLAALGLLALAGSASYDAVFVGSLCAALIGLIVLVSLRPTTGPARSRSTGPVGSASRRCCARPAFRRLCLVAALLGLVTIGDGFVFLVLQDRDDLPVVAFPLLAVGTSLAFLLLAVPLGRLADRVGRWPVVVAGYACLLAVYVLLAFSSVLRWC